MKKRFRFLCREDGAELVEAAFIYPLVLLVISGLIYTGLFILQYMTVGAYAQKAALLAAREVAYPGYISLIDADNVSNSAIEIALDDYSKSVSSDENKANGQIINFPTAAYDVHARAYRYWKKDPLECGALEDYQAKSILENILSAMVNQNAILVGKVDADITITCRNVIVAQYVTVDVEQDLVNNQLLRALGVKNPSVHVSAVASANDTDEFIRNTDLVCDALEMIAKKLNIDVDSIRDKVSAAKQKLGLD